MPWNTGPDEGQDTPPAGGPWRGGGEAGHGNDQGNGERPPPGRGSVPPTPPPFGRPGQGGGSHVDLGELLGEWQARLQSLLPRRNGGGDRPPGGGEPGAGGLGRYLPALVPLALLLLWLASGFYTVQPDEAGVVTRFGAYVRTTGEGLNYRLPWPIESVRLPKVRQINRIEIGFRSGPDGQIIQSGQDGDNGGIARTITAGGVGNDILEESLMLTGDENIVDIDFVVLWQIQDPAQFLFNLRTPPGDDGAAVKAVAESVMREVIGRTPIMPAMTDARVQIEDEVLREVQAILDSYKAGVKITQVQLQKVDPPAAVVDNFRDVQRASADADRARNDAQGYQNDIVPRARGEAAQIVAKADAGRQATVAMATGETQRFLQVLTAYRAAKDITLRRMYIETMQALLADAPSLIVDERLKGVVPFLPLTPQASNLSQPPQASNLSQPPQASNLPQAPAGEPKP